MKYRKKSIIIDAFQLGTDPLPDWIVNAEAHGMVTIQFSKVDGVQGDIETLEGTMHISNGDFIICGVNGEIYPCKPDIFKKTYERVE